MSGGEKAQGRAGTTPKPLTSTLTSSTKLAGFEDRWHQQRRAATTIAVAAVARPPSAAPKGGMARPGSECVRVCVRCRPQNSRETGQGVAVAVDESAGQVALACVRSTEPPRAFTFDAVFGPEASQQDVYNATARDLVNSVLAGFNATVFAYGQTGTGKTHTMEGRKTSGAGRAPCRGGHHPAHLSADFQHHRRQPGADHLFGASQHV